jgi:hypothetical protein
MQDHAEEENDSKLEIASGKSAYVRQVKYNYRSKLQDESLQNIQYE